MCINRIYVLYTVFRIPEFVNSGLTHKIGHISHFIEHIVLYINSITKSMKENYQCSMKNDKSTVHVYELINSWILFSLCHSVIEMFLPAQGFLDWATASRHYRPRGSYEPGSTSCHDGTCGRLCVGLINTHCHCHQSKYGLPSHSYKHLKFHLPKIRDMSETDGQGFKK